MRAKKILNYTPSMEKNNKLLVVTTHEKQNSRKKTSWSEAILRVLPT
jgi:hypothetical protein